MQNFRGGGSITTSQAELETDEGRPGGTVL